MFSVPSLNQNPVLHERNLGLGAKIPVKRTADSIPQIKTTSARFLMFFMLNRTVTSDEEVVVLTGPKMEPLNSFDIVCLKEM